jgi:hypothetical protein
VTVIAGLLIVALIALQFFHMRERDQIRTETARERASLLERIQRPEIRQVEATYSPPPEIPQDAAELSWVGLEVPEFVNVGGEENG